MDYILFFLRNGLERADTELADFKTRFESNPHDAFSWADKAMKAAARKRWFSHYIAAIEGATDENRTEANLKKIVLKELLSRTSSLPKSSSVTGNAMGGYDIEVLSDLVDAIVVK
jgi:hypothetical protein